MYAVGQAAVDLHHFFVHGLRHGAAVLADKHEHRAQNDLAAVVSGCPCAQFAAQAHVGDIANTHRYAVGTAQNDIANVLQRLDLARCTDQILLAAFFDIARTHVAIVAIDGRDDVLQRHPQ